jgi:hypothetical protein
VMVSSARISGVNNRISRASVMIPLFMSWEGKGCLYVFLIRFKSLGCVCI